MARPDSAYGMDDYYEDLLADDGETYCWRCGGKRFIITCPDDMCRGAGECFHGDGHKSCPECNRNGQLDWELD